MVIPMGHELQENADTLRGIVAQLNTAAAEASAVVQAVDVFLGDELSIGVSASSRPFDTQRVTGDDDSELVVTSHLAYGRVQGKERLHVLKATLAKNEWKEDFTKTVAEDRIPWSSCSREVKLQSFVKLPELLSALATRVEEVATQTSRTVETVRSLIDTMKEPHDPGRPAVELDNVVEDEFDLPRDIPLHELTVSAAPTLFKRPRKAGAA
jgi:hypothetical protein